MGIWEKFGTVAAEIVERAPIRTLFERLRDQLFGDAEERRQMAFTMAMVALSAKMAKADGVVTADEIAAFERLFHMPVGQERNIARFFDFARQDVAGFEAYASQVAELYPDSPEMLEDILDGLFQVAGADGAMHEAELLFLEQVGAIFGLADGDFQRIKARHVVPDASDPYVILGIDRSISDSELKRHYRRLVMENHPDRHIALGVPEEFVVIATEKLAIINEAYDRIAKERRL
ncbi:MAG: TerB family tellurite resistance protein [Hyphomicrobiales bacterium]